MTDPLRVVIFAAKSTADEKGSIPQQTADCEAHAKAQGWIVDARESDEAASAFTGNRGPGLERAMARAEALAKAHGRAGLLVWHSNRIARGGGDAPQAAKHLAEYLFWAQRANVELHSVQDNFTFSNPILAVVMGEMAHQESKAKSAAVKRGMKGRRAKRLHTGGAIYGYDRDSELGLRPNPEQAPTVERIFRLIAGGKSQAEVARILNREGVKPLRGSQWVQGSLAAMLKRRTYLGEIQDDDGNWIDAAHSPIVHRDLWEAANRARESAAQAKGRKGGPRPKAGHLLPGRMLRHAVCGSAMTPVSLDARKDGTIHGRYECSGRKAGVCEGFRVDMADLDEALVSYLAAVGIDADESLRRVKEATQSRRDATAAELEAARREHARIAAERDRMWGLFKAGDLDPDDWRTFKREHEEESSACAARVAQLEARAAEADAAPEAIVPAVADALGIVRTAMANGDSDAVRAALETLFESFLVGELADMPGQAIIGTTQEMKAARKRVREQIAAMEGAAGRTVAEAEADYWSEQAALDEAEPEPSEDDAPIADSAGVVIVPQPREDALASIVEEGQPVQLVDERGRSIFRRIPLELTNNEGLTR